MYCNFLGRWEKLSWKTEIVLYFLNHNVLICTMLGWSVKMRSMQELELGNKWVGTDFSKTMKSCECFKVSAICSSFVINLSGLGSCIKITKYFSELWTGFYIIQWIFKTVEKLIKFIIILACRSMHNRNISSLVLYWN